MDVDANRASRKWSRKEMLGRVVWMLAIPFFRLSPRPFWGWRRLILRSFGAKIGAQVHIYPNVSIAIPWNLDIGEQSAIGDGAYVYSLGKIVIGPRTTISQRANLCAGTHDWKDDTMPLIKAPITIGADVWICAEAFVGPGVNVSDRAIVGARSVVTKQVDAGLIVAGNPAQKIGVREATE